MPTHRDKLKWNAYKPYNLLIINGKTSSIIFCVGYLIYCVQALYCGVEEKRNQIKKNRPYATKHLRIAHLCNLSDKPCYYRKETEFGYSKYGYLESFMQIQFHVSNNPRQRYISK